LQAAGGMANTRGPATLTLPAESGSEGVDFQAAANLRVSAPLVRLLRRVNPILGQIKSGEGLFGFQLSELQVTSGNVGNAQATARLTFPALELRTDGLVGELLRIGGAADSQAHGAIAAVADPLRLHLGGGSIGYDNFNLVLGRRQRLSFGGSVNVDGRLNLLARVPEAARGADGEGTLSSSRSDVPLSGTVEHPVVTLP
jgi:hypothetical protein